MSGIDSTRGRRWVLSSSGIMTVTGVSMKVDVVNLVSLLPAESDLVGPPEPLPMREAAFMSGSAQP